METTSPATLPEARQRVCLEALAAFLPAFREPGFEFGVWRGGEVREDGVIMNGAFERGLLTVIVKRAAELVAQ